jgi:hypothetical protein
MRSDSFAQQSKVFYCGADSSSGFGIGLTNSLVPGQDSYATLLLGGVSLIATGNSFRAPSHKWVHVAIIRSPSEWRIYKNGALVGRTTSIGIGPNENITIGNGFYGAITRLRIWTRALDRSELVLSMCSANILDSSLMAEYTPTTTGVLDSLPDVLLMSPPMKAAGAVTVINYSDFPDYGPPPDVTLLSFPSHMQFFARGKDDSSRILISGSMTPLAGDSLQLELLTNDSSIDSIMVPATSQFQFIAPIHCELSEYTVRLFVERSGNKLFVAEGADLLSGDVFLIDGQSNAHPAIDGYNWQNAFSRTIGVQTDSENLAIYDPADTLWGLSFATGQGQLFSGPYFVGSWARWMQEGIADEWNVPTCVINGAAGGSTIVQHFREDNDPTDSTSIYGRLLFRIMKSGLQHEIRGIFWYQGEWDSGLGYLSSFRTLYNEWDTDYSREDLAPVSHFVFQIRPNTCNISDSKVREAQREIPDSLPDCALMSTNGIDGYDACHYFWNGYEAIGEEAVRFVGKHLYGSADTIDVDPPDILEARYSDQTHTSISVRFRQPIAGLIATPDSTAGGSYRRIEDAFYLDGQSGLVSTLTINGDTISLLLDSESNAKTITYLPDQTYDDNSLVYSGPWIENSKGVGALSFYGIPINEPEKSDVHTITAPTSSLRVVQSSETGRPLLFVNLSTPAWAKIGLTDVLGRNLSTIADEWIGEDGEIFPIPANLPEGFFFATLAINGEIISTKLSNFP